MFLKIGVHADKLSLARGDRILRIIRQSHPEAQVERKIIDGSLAESGKSIHGFKGPKRFFDHILYEAVLDGRVDLAIFNMKDLPFLKDGGPLVLAATLERSSPYEALVSRQGQSLEELKAGASVEASNLLRIAQLHRFRPDLQVRTVGGRVEDRVYRLDRGEYDALIVAESGLAQLGMTAHMTQRLSINDFTPIPCQGITAILARRNNLNAIQAVKEIDDPKTRLEAIAERGLETILRADCNVPLGCYSRVNGNKIELAATVLSPDGETRFQVSMSELIEEPQKLAQRVAKSLISQGARALEEGWRRQYPLDDD